jgi:hypothetical protein
MYPVSRVDRHEPLNILLLLVFAAAAFVAVMR